MLVTWLGSNFVAKPNKYSSKTEEKICNDASWKYRESGLISLDYEILIVINELNSFNLFLNKHFTITTDCKAIVKIL